MKVYHNNNSNNIMRDILISLLCGVAMFVMIIGAAIQHQDRVVALAAMEVE